MTDILMCNNLTKFYGKTAALQDINLNLPAGRIIGLLGPNGSGKTTFLKIANGLLQPSSGEVKYNDPEVKNVLFPICQIALI